MQSFYEPRVQFLEKYNVFVVDWFTKEGKHFYATTHPIKKEAMNKPIILDHPYDPITNPNGYDMSPDEGEL